ncbi:MAG: hypothetical protein ACP5VQ_05905 [Phycisphaerae bacterium]
MRGWKTIHGEGFMVEVPNDFTAIKRDDGHLLIHDPAESILMDLQMTAGSDQAEGSDRSGGLNQDGVPPVNPQQALARFKQWLGRYKGMRLTEAPQQVLGMYHVTCTAQACDRLGIFSGLLRKVLKKDSVRGSRFWAVFYGQNVVFASCRGTCEAVDFLKAIADSIVAGVRIGVRDTLKSPFIQAVVELARDITKNAAVEAVDDETISVGGMRIQVSPLHNTYLEQPEQLAEKVNRFFDDLLVLDPDAPDDAADNPWFHVRNDIYPVLVPRALAATQPATIIIEEWVNDLMICYQVSSRSSLITMEDCRQWGVDQETLHEHAMGNLARSTRELNMAGGRCDNYTLFSFPMEHPRNAVRVLLPLVQKHLRPHLGNNFYMAIPDRDVLLAFACDDQETLTWFRHQMKLRYSKAVNPLSDRLFLVTPDGVVGDIYDVEEKEGNQGQ